MAEPLTANLVLFGRLLRAAGLPVAPGQTLDFARALAHVDVGSRDQVFHAARSFFVGRREELAIFALLFERFFAGGEAAGRTAAPPAPRDEPPPRRYRSASLLGARGAPAEAESELDRRSRTYSDQEVLQHKAFSDMTAEELAELRRLILGMRWQASMRRTRRWTGDVRGPRLHLRKMLRDAAKHAGAPLSVTRRRRKSKRRPIVLLADISGSMEVYSRILLQLFYGAVHGLGGDVECFVFGTRLTRITPSLRLRNVDRALADAAAEILDWSGGTRIGESVGAFNRHWARRLLRRGAIVIVASDGWDRGDVEVLRREMRHLRHRCHRLIWLNPHAAQPGYRPLVEGMAAALPYVDDFLPVHNLESLRDLAAALVELPARRRGAVRTTAH